MYRPTIFNLLFNKEIKEYITLDYSVLELIDFRVFADIAGKEYELTGKETLICLDPLKICIIDEIQLPEKIVLFYLRKEVIIATVHCIKLSIDSTVGSVQIYQICDSSIMRHSLFYLSVYYFRINHAKKDKLLFRQYMNLASGFFYPRKVVLVSSACEKFNSIFPMDFKLRSQYDNIIVLGLRKTNKTNVFTANRNLKLSFADFSEINKSDAYAFGKFHSIDFPDIRDLPYKFIKTEQNQNFFPDFINSYNELRLLHCVDIGLQNLFICRVINEVRLKNSYGPSLYHLHYLSSV